MVFSFSSCSSRTPSKIAANWNVVVVQTAFTEPKDPTSTDKKAWGKDYDRYLKNTDRYKMDKAKIFAWICSHCTLSQ